MLRVLVLVVLIVATKAYVEEFSNENLRALYNFDPNPVNAEFIKPSKPLSLERGGADTPNAISLFPLHMPDEPQDDKELCGQYHGVKLLESEEVFCKISRISLVTNIAESDFEQALYLDIFFDEGFSDPKFRMVVPIFQIPFDCDPNAEDEMHQKPGLQWAHDNQVGILNDNDEEENELQKIPKHLAENNPVTINFEWLGHLLSYGIFKFPPGYQGHCYLTRPIILPFDVMDNFMEVVLNIDKPGYRFSFRSFY